MPKASRLERMFRAHAAIKDKRARNAKVFKDLDKSLRTKQEMFETQMLKVMNETGTDQLKVKGVGMCFIQNKTIPHAKDWNAVYNFIQENGEFDLMQKRLAMGGVKEYVELHGEPPPGVDITVERVVAVRRDRKSEGK